MKKVKLLEKMLSGMNATRTLLQKKGYDFGNVESIHFKVIGTGQDGLFRIYCAEEDEVILPAYYKKIGSFGELDNLFR